MTDFTPTEQNQVRQIAKRARYDREIVYAIVDEALICHVGFQVAGQPFVLPTLHAREVDRLLLHGAVGSRLIRHVQAGHPVCASMALVDGWVLGKAVCSHSINYRSVVLFGQGRLVVQEQDKLHALEVLTERLAPGRWAEARKPNARELQATAVVAIDIQSASAKVREGPPRDSPQDREWPVWAGVVPLQQVAGTPIRAAYTEGDRAAPETVGVHLHGSL